MNTSLYCVGTCRIELGRYGMSVEEAKKDFLKKAAECGCEVKAVKDGLCGTKFTLREGSAYYKANRKLLYMVANVVDLHGDAPAIYELDATPTSSNQYVKTGSFAD